VHPWEHGHHEEEDDEEDDDEEDDGHSASAKHEAKSEKHEDDEDEEGKRGGDGGDGGGGDGDNVKEQLSDAKLLKAALQREFPERKAMVHTFNLARLRRSVQEIFDDEAEALVHSATDDYYDSGHVHLAIPPGFTASVVDDDEERREEADNAEVDWAIDSPEGIEAMMGESPNQDFDSSEETAINNW
jgi:hypothetical protein